MSDETADKTISPYKLVQIQWPEPGPAVYANNLCIQYDGTSVLLTFAQVNPPLVIGREEETKKLHETMSSVVATPIIRLVVPLDNFRMMLGLINEHMNKIEKIAKPDCNSLPTAARIAPNEGG